LRFRKVFVPQGDIEALKRDYMPIRRDKFEQLLAEIESQSAAPGQLAARIQRAEYTAVLDGAQLINGQAKLDVVHHATDASLLPLAPCNLALGPATWQGDEDGERAASLGMDPQGALVAIVERSATLQLPWTANGTVNQLREIAFDLALAPSGLNRIQLELPTNLTPTVDRGVVSLVADHESAERLEGEPGPAGNTWSIELGGATRVRLVLKPHESQRRRDQLVMAREDTRYEMTTSGLDLSTSLQLDVYHEPLTRLNVTVPRELHIVAARVAGREADWSVANISVGGMKQLQIPLTTPLIGLGQSIEIEAIGPLQTDVPWKLPRLRPESVFWQEGRLTLDVPQDLRLVQLIADQARQSGIGTTDNAGESHRFQLYSASGSLQVILRRRQSEVSVTVGTTIDLDPGTLTAQTIADFALNTVSGSCWKRICRELGESMESSRLWLTRSMIIKCCPFRPTSNVCRSASARPCRRNNRCDSRSARIGRRVFSCKKSTSAPFSFATFAVSRRWWPWPRIPATDWT
jgi:hypothetical protein